MSSPPVTFLAISFLFLMILERAFSAENTLTNPAGTKSRDKWVSMVVSEHIWKYQVASETNPQCTRHFEIYRQHLRNFTTWAVQMFDSSDLVPGGFIVGDYYKLGNFEGCINSQVPQELGFSAQYCLPAFKFRRLDLDVSVNTLNEWEDPIWNRIQSSSNNRTKAPKDRFSLAFCIPSTCSPQDLQVSLQNLLEGPMRDADYSLSVAVDDLKCATIEGPPKSTGFFVMRYFMTSITYFLLFCTLAEILIYAVRRTKHSRSNATGVEKLVLFFSIFRNLRMILAPITSPDDYKILHGIKAVLTISVIFAHRAAMACTNTALVNWAYFETRIQDFSIYYVAMPLPDVFFCLSGFLLCLSMMKQFEKNKFSVLTHIVNKVTRVLPPYIFVMAYSIFTLPHWGRGPLWKTIVESELDYCRKGWWTHLLFLNNYVNLGDWCYMHSYYIAADMHFFAAGSVIVYLCQRWKRHQVAILGSALILSFLLPFCTIAYNQLEGLTKLYYDGLSDLRSVQMLLHLYMKSHCRFGGYIVGIIGAFVFRHLQLQGRKFSKAAAWFGVFIALSMIFAISLVRHYLHKPTTAYNVTEHALYAGLNAQILCIAVMIIVIMQMITGFGLYDGLFLALDFFVPFSRLSYWTFLLNVPIIMVLIASSKTPIHLTYEELTFTGKHWGDVLLTYFISAYCYLIIDVPMNFIRPTILKRTSKMWIASVKKEQ